MDVCTDKLNIIKCWKHYLMLCNFQPKWKTFSLICPPLFTKFHLTYCRQWWKSSHGKKGHTFLSGKNHCFICLTIRRFMLLSHGETLDFPWEEFALRGSICKPVPQTKHLRYLSCFLCKNFLLPWNRRIKGNSFPWSKERLLLLVAELTARPG